MKDDRLNQWMISILGVSALLLVTFGFQWGALLGLASQVFWFRTSILHKQKGIIALCFVYTAVWVSGVIRWLCY